TPPPSFSIPPLPPTPPLFPYTTLFRSAPAAPGPPRPHVPSGLHGLRSMIQTLSETGLDIEAYTAARRAAGQPVILDLGCGANKVPGAFGIDIVALTGVDLVHDLKATPYPLPESCADTIYLNHVLEHFEN